MRAPFLHTAPSDPRDASSNGASFDAGIAAAGTDCGNDADPDAPDGDGLSQAETAATRERTTIESERRMVTSMRGRESSEKLTVKLIMPVPSRTRDEFFGEEGFHVGA